MGHSSKDQLTPRLAVFDIDGTLVDSRGQIPASTKFALKLLRESGVQLGLASGRPAFSAKEIISELEITAPSSFFSGALVINPVTNQELQAKYLESTEVLELLELARKQNLYFELYSTTNYFTDCENDYSKIHQQYGLPRPQSIQLEKILQHLDTTNLKLIKALSIASNSEERERLLHYSQQLSNFSVGITPGSLHQGVTFLNITSRKANRSAVFDFILGQTNLRPEEVIAFGDGLQDLEFISRAGFGIALGNAQEELKQHAWMVTESVDNDGIFHAVKTILRNNFNKIV